MEQNWTNLTNYIKAGYRSNAYAPLVWLMGLIFMVLSGLYCITDNLIIRYALISVIIFTILFALVIYVVLLIKDPKLLQSENFRLEDKRLDMITQKGSDIIINPVNLVPPISNLRIEGGDND